MLKEAVVVPNLKIFSSEITMWAFTDTECKNLIYKT